jgi:hypothetical protein
VIHLTAPPVNPTGTRPTLTTRRSADRTGQLTAGQPVNPTPVSPVNPPPADRSTDRSTDRLTAGQLTALTTTAPAHPDQQATPLTGQPTRPVN